MEFKGRVLGLGDRRIEHRIGAGLGSMPRCLRQRPPDLQLADGNADYSDRENWGQLQALTRSLD